MAGAHAKLTANKTADRTKLLKYINALAIILDAKAKHNKAVRLHGVLPYNACFISRKDEA
jgi:hypothetical protein